MPLSQFWWFLDLGGRLGSLYLERDKANRSGDHPWFQLDLSEAHEVHIWVGSFKIEWSRRAPREEGGDNWTTLRSMAGSSSRSLSNSER